MRDIFETRKTIFLIEITESRQFNITDLFVQPLSLLNGTERLTQHVGIGRPSTTFNS